MRRKQEISYMILKITCWSTREIGGLKLRLIPKLYMADNKFAALEKPLKLLLSKLNEIAQNGFFFLTPNPYMNSHSTENILVQGREEGAGHCHAVQSKGILCIINKMMRDRIRTFSRGLSYFWPALVRYIFITMKMWRFLFPAIYHYDILVLMIWLLI